MLFLAPHSPNASATFHSFAGVATAASAPLMDGWVATRVQWMRMWKAPPCGSTGCVCAHENCGRTRSSAAAASVESPAAPRVDVRWRGAVRASRRVRSEARDGASDVARQWAVWAERPTGSRALNGALCAPRHATEQLSTARPTAAKPTRSVRCAASALLRPASWTFYDRFRLIFLYFHVPFI